MEWWLISNDDVIKIRKYLCLPSRFEQNESRREALHCLESGLHSTTAIPDDFKEKQNGT